MTKICPKCKIAKDISSFAINRSRPDGLQIYCRLCKKQSDSNHYKKHKTRQLERNKILRLRYRDEIRKYKSQKGCCKCGEKEACCLDFHHTNQHDKEREVSSMHGTYSLKAIWIEISKCVVVCANCHRKIHNEIISL